MSGSSTAALLTAARAAGARWRVALASLLLDGQPYKRKSQVFSGSLVLQAQILAVISLLPISRRYLRISSLFALCSMLLLPVFPISENFRFFEVFCASLVLQARFFAVILLLPVKRTSSSHKRRLFRRAIAVRSDSFADESPVAPIRFGVISALFPNTCPR